MTPPENLMVNVKRVVAVDRDRVFEAWTDPASIKEWFARPPGFEIPEVTVDLRPGGRYRIHMTSPDGASQVLEGEYREVVVPERLVYSWSWADKDDDPTQVTVTFTDVGRGTEISIVHGSFPTQELQIQHSEGWQLCIDGVERVESRR